MKNSPRQPDKDAAAAVGEPAEDEAMDLATEELRRLMRDYGEELRGFPGPPPVPGAAVEASLGLGDELAGESPGAPDAAPAP